MSNSDLRNYVAQLAMQFQTAQGESTNLKTIIAALQESQSEMKAEIAELKEARKNDLQPLPMLGKDNEISTFGTPFSDLPSLSGISAATPLSTPLPNWAGFSGHSALSSAASTGSALLHPPPYLKVSGATSYPKSLIDAKKNGLRAEMKRSMLANHKFGDEKTNLQPAIKGTMEAFKETIQNTVTN